MTIPGGGGGGKKIPGGPKPPSTPPAAAQPPTPTKPATPTSAPPARDGFEQTKTDPRFARGVPIGDPTSASALDHSTPMDMVRLLEDTRAQILDEHKALREKAFQLVQALAQSGFERALLEHKRAELSELRQRLAAQRKRLQHIQRRLKAALSKTARHGDVDLSRSIQAHLDRMKKLEPGLQRALLALLALEQAAAGLVDGGLLKLVGAATAEARGSALARLGPGSVVARATTALLTGKPERLLLTASTEGAPVNSEEDTDDVDALGGLQAVAETLLASF